MSHVYTEMHCTWDGCFLLDPYFSSSPACNDSPELPGHWRMKNILSSLASLTRWGSRSNLISLLTELLLCSSSWRSIHRGWNNNVSPGTRVNMNDDYKFIGYTALFFPCPSSSCLLPACVCSCSLDKTQRWTQERKPFDPDGFTFLSLLLVRCNTQPLMCFFRKKRESFTISLATCAKVNGSLEPILQLPVSMQF